MAKAEKTLPPGQFDYGEMPRFGLPRYARRFPAADRDRGVLFKAPGGAELYLSEKVLRARATHEQSSDFHCVTTWSARAQHWRGVAFATLYRELSEQLDLDDRLGFVVLRAHDGYRTSFHLEDLLASDVMLACDRTPAAAPRYAAQSEDAAGQIKHGLPWRLVSPGQYGYKNVKFVKEIEFRPHLDDYVVPGWTFMDHPRARVALEERARHVPGWLIRYPYRALIKNTVRLFADTWAQRN